MPPTLPVLCHSRRRIILLRPERIAQTAPQVREARSFATSRRQAVRSKLFDGLFGLWTLLQAPLIPCLALVRRPSLARSAIRFWTAGFSVLSRGILRQRVREVGLENKHLDSPCIYVCNHQSTWETLAFNRLVPDICIIAKRELRRIPIFGWFLEHAPMILIDRNGGARALAGMITQAREEVAKGRSILIFPEGTRVGVEDRCAFQPGLIALYRKLGLPIVPVAHNAGHVWRKGIKTEGTITVAYFPAVPPGRPAAEAVMQVEALLNVEKDRLAPATS
ncbi:MAG: 1-acyl-sn-glycerol-3-phosphate acyltransferase [Rhodobacteraceae bacterium]|nr:MAG: 1-acyl-sn-glycerol-3-phosphate acyltransferase [Paracoccaceae bacterium]